MCLYTNRIQVKPHLLLCDKSICVSQLVRKANWRHFTNHNVIHMMCHIFLASLVASGNEASARWNGNELDWE